MGKDRGGGDSQFVATVTMKQLWLPYEATIAGSSTWLICCVVCFFWKFGFICSAIHIPGVNNGIADALSRNRLDVFCTLAPQARAEPTLVPRGLLEGLMGDEPWTSAAWERWFATI